MDSRLTEFTNYHVAGSLVAYEFPSLILNFTTSQIKLGQLLLRDGECKTFIEQNQANLKEIDESLAACWAKIAQNPQWAIQKARYVECIATGVRSLPVLNVIATISSVIGLTASGVATVVVLTPLVGALTAAFLEHTQWAAAKEAISQINYYLSAIKPVGIFAIISANQFLTGGVTVGLTFFSKILSLNVTLLLVAKYVLNPYLKKHREALNLATPPTDMDQAMGELKLLEELKVLFGALKRLQQLEPSKERKGKEGRGAYLIQIKNIQTMCQELETKAPTFLSLELSESVRMYCQEMQNTLRAETKQIHELIRNPALGLLDS